MTNAAITKVLKKIELQSQDYSLGFRILISLPIRVRRNFDLASNLETNFNSGEALENQKKFLESLSNQELINWLKIIL